MGGGGSPLGTSFDREGSVPGKPRDKLRSLYGYGFSAANRKDATRICRKGTKDKKKGSSRKIKTGPGKKQNKQGQQRG